MILQLLFALFSFATSIWGLLAFLVGFLVFLMLPFVHRVTGEFESLARLHVWLAMWVTGRSAFVVTEHDGLLFKRMSFVDAGVEKISFGNSTKEFEDPSMALHYFMGVPFALADEPHGLLIDPWHCAVGARKKAAEAQNKMVVKATADERDMYDVFGWVRAFFEFDPDSREMVQLSDARQLVTGSERAEHPERIKQWYEYSRQPYQDGPSATRVAVLIGAMVIPFAALWMLATQGTSTGASDSVSFGVSMLILGHADHLLRRIRRALPTPEDAEHPEEIDWAWFIRIFSLPLLALYAGVVLLYIYLRRALPTPPPGDDPEAIDWEYISNVLKVPFVVTAAGVVLASQHIRRGLPGPEDADDPQAVDWTYIAIILGVVLPLPTAFLIIGVVFGPILAALVAVMFTGGVLALPALTFVARQIGPIGGAFGRYLYLRTGLLGYDRPVLDWTATKYELCEYDELDDVENVRWYGIAGSLLGITFDPDPEPWGEAAWRGEEIDPRLEIPDPSTSTDGAGKTNIPVGYTRFPDLRRAVYGGFVPTSNQLDEDAWYLQSGIALSEFANASIGHRSYAKLQEAKEEEGGNQGIDDGTFHILTAALSIVSFIAGLVVFFL